MISILITILAAITAAACVVFAMAARNIAAAAVADSELLDRLQAERVSLVASSQDASWGALRNGVLTAQSDDVRIALRAALGDQDNG